MQFSHIQHSTVGVFSPLVFGKKLAQQKAAFLPVSFLYPNCCYIRLAPSQSASQKPPVHNTCTATALMVCLPTIQTHSLFFLLPSLLHASCLDFCCHRALLHIPLTLAPSPLSKFLTDWLTVAYSWLDLLPTPSLLDWLWFCGLGVFEPCLFIWSCQRNACII